MTEVELFRSNHAIDPHLEIWRWEIPVYLFLGGIAAGVMILASIIALRKTSEASVGTTALADRGTTSPEHTAAREHGTLSRWARWLPFAAPLLISLGMGALFLDLAFKEHVYRFYLAFKPLSPMSWGAWILIGLYPASLLLGVAHLTTNERERLVALSPLSKIPLAKPLSILHAWSKKHHSKLAWLNIAIGVGLGAYTGLLLGTLAARPTWNSTMLAPLFLVSGISTGAAFMMLFPLGKDEHRWIQRWDLAAIGLEAILLALFLLSLFAGGGELGRTAAMRFVGGPLTGPFFALVVFGGLVVPFVLELLERRRHLRATVLAPALILVGGLALRWLIVMAGQS